MEAVTQSACVGSDSNPVDLFLLFLPPCFQAVEDVFVVALLVFAKNKCVQALPIVMSHEDSGKKIRNQVNPPQTP
jgi:hypothetical protein